MYLFLKIKLYKCKQVENVNSIKMVKQSLKDYFPKYFVRQW